jgi:hypothetical protein
MRSSRPHVTADIARSGLEREVHGARGTVRCFRQDMRRCHAEDPPVRPSNTAIAVVRHVSRGKPIPRGPSLNKKRKLLPGPSQRLGVSFALPRLAPKGRQSPCPGWGILTPFPFGCMQA